MPEGPRPPLRRRLREPVSPSDSCIVKRLKELFLFREWTEEDLLTVGRFSRLRKCGKSDVLFQHGDACDHLYVLLAGRLQMHRLLPDGREVTLHIVASGALVACAALFLDKTFPASARVLSHTAEIAVLQGRPFLKLLEDRPDLSRKMIGGLAARITDLADRIESRNASSARVRLAAWLLDQPSRPGHDSHERIVVIEGNKKTLAGSLGMTPETFSRCLKSLSNDSILEVRGREIVLRDLRRIAELS